ncbi:MAG: hypothetical protein V3V08_01710 [Nannocystaceae bacterium]
MCGQTRLQTALPPDPIHAIHVRLRRGDLSMFLHNLTPRIPPVRPVPSVPFRFSPSVGSVFAFCALAATSLGFGACTPTAESGQCNSDADCYQRGQVCTNETHECIDDLVDFDATQSEPEPNFTAKVLPFFRGRICTVAGEFQSGAALPLRMEPCVHPCIRASNGTSHVFHLRECRGGACNGLSVEWFEGDGADCPDDAFARFDPDLCEYPITLAGRHPPFEANGSPIVGRFQLEIPFLTNDDAAQIANFNAATASAACVETCGGMDSQDKCRKGCFMRERAEHYAQDENRVLSFQMTAEAPPPPPNCETAEGADDACPCVDVGF